MKKNGAHVKRVSQITEVTIYFFGLHVQRENQVEET